MCVAGVGAGLKLISILFFCLVWNIVRKKALRDTEQVMPDLGAVSRQPVLPVLLHSPRWYWCVCVIECVCECVCVCV